ncbi:MAG TPA: type III-A CRISPR-associated RAMP protein Csm3 [Deltaproteobacteria bacterium]|nr:type III-A CRISPR-associated RAMP protein Csm3 [Deltaproteobacteria bacterium]
MKLVAIKEISGKIELLSGLHIGAGDTEMHIGGTDNPVLRHPHTNEPYIPGSSLKGKVRSLLELKSGLMTITKGNPLQAGDLKRMPSEKKDEAEHILKIFGSSGSEKDDVSSIGPTRVSFSDCPLNDAWRQKAKNERLSLFEVKSENAINRISGTAQNPRFTERVPAGSVFDFSVSLKILGENEEELFDYLLMGLKLLELDSLGGSGSRGYGRIRFSFDDDAVGKKFEEIRPL